MAYGMAGDATPDNNSMMGIGNSPLTSTPGSLEPHYDAALTIEDAVNNRGLHPHIGKNGVAVASGEEFVYDGPDRPDIGLVHGKTYRWGDTHGGSSKIPDVYMPDAPPERGVSAERVARDQAFMAANNPRFSGASFPSVPPSGATYKEPAAPFAGAQYKRPATDEELSDAGLQSEVQRQTARSGLYASAEKGIPTGWTPEERQVPAAPEGALPVVPVSSQQIAQQAQQVQDDDSVADEDKDVTTTNNILEQHSAALRPNDARVTRRINADTGSYRISGKYFVPGDPVHEEKLLADVSDEDKAKLPAIATAIGRGEPFSFLHYSAPVEEGAEEGPTRSSRAYEQSLSTAEQRIAGTAAGQLQRATIIPQQFAVSEPKAGQPHTVSLEGFYNDAALHNAVHTINAANAVGIPIPYGSINEPKFQRDLGGYIQNQQHGFRGDGQGPLIGPDNQPVVAYRQEQAKAPADQYMPHLLNKDEADFVNTAVNIVPPAGKKPANLPAGFGEKARWLQRVNEGYIGKEYGPNRLRETLDRMMPMEAKGRGKPRPWSKHKLEQTYARFRLENIKSTMPHPLSPESIRAHAGAFEPHVIPRAPKEVYTAAEHKASPVSQNPEMGAPLGEGINHANNGSSRPDNNGAINVRAPRAFNGAIDAAPIAQPVGQDPEIGAPIGEGKEKITHAGVRFRSGNIYLGPFHGAAYQSGLEAGEPEEPDTTGQGFFTNHGRFLTRAEYFSEAAKRRTAAPPAPIGRNPEIGAPIGEGQEEFQSVGPHEFIRQRNLSKRPQYLSALAPEDLASHKLWMNQSGTAGAAVSPEGDVQNVFNNGGGHGAGSRALAHALRNGGKTLDAYDPYLPRFYRQFGFKETGRMKFNRNYAPPNWDFENDDEPDVVFMAHEGYPDNEQAAVARASGPPANWIHNERSNSQEVDWDKAKERSRKRADRVAGKGHGSEAHGEGKESSNPSGPGNGQPIAGNPEVGAPLGESQEDENEGTPGLAEESSGQRRKGKSSAGSHARRLAAYIEALSGPEAESTENLDRDYFLRSQEIKRQEKILLQLAKDRGELHGPMAEPAHAGGGEHDVWFDPDGKRVTKEVSSYGSEGFGFAPNMERTQLEAPPRRVKLRHATPLEYLQRLQLGKEHFGDDTHFLGVSQTPHSIRLRTSQKRIHHSEPPSWDEMTDSMMDEHGFEPHPTIDDLWQHPGTGTLASDVLPRNFVKNEQGKPVPVDIVLHHAAPVSANPEMGAPLGEGQEESAEPEPGEPAEHPMPTPEQVQGFNPRLAGGQYPANVQPERRVTLPPAPIAVRRQTAAPKVAQAAQAVSQETRNQLGPRPKNKEQGSVWDRFAGALDKQIPGAIPLRPARTKKGELKIDKKGNPQFEEEGGGYHLANAPMLGDKALGYDKKGSVAKAPEGTVDLVAPNDLPYLNPTDRLRISHLIQNGGIDAYADALGKEYDRVEKEIPEALLAKDWYNDTEGFLKKHFGKDADLVANLLAVTSARTGVKTNYGFAMHAYHRYARGDYDRHIDLYRKAYALKQQGALANHVAQLIDPETGKNYELPESEAKAMARYIEHHDILPTQHDLDDPTKKGPEYGMHSPGVLKVLAENWLEQLEGPKTGRYTGNMTGRSIESTGDMWVGRQLRRLGFEGYTKEPWLIQPGAEPGLSNLDFAIQELAHRKASGKRGLEPRQHQAILWTSEIKHWLGKNWSKGGDPAERDYRPMLKEYKRPEWARRPSAPGQLLAAPIA